MESKPVVKHTSLGGQLVRRVSLLSLIAIVALAMAMVTRVAAGFVLVQRDLEGAGANAARTFDLFLSSLESDLQATGDLVTTSNDVPQVFRATLQRSPAIFQVSLIDPQGNIVAQRRRVGTVDETTIAQQPWLDTVRAGKVYVGQVTSQEFGVPFIDIGVRVLDESGSFSGTLLAKIDLTTLWSKVSAIQVGATGYAYITDNDGRLLAFRDLKLIQNGAHFQDITGRTPQAVEQSTLYNVYMGASGRPVVGVSVPLTAVPWFAVVEQPLEEALQGFVLLSALLLVAFCIVVWIVIGLVRFSRRKIVTPILTLRDSVDAIRQGDLKERIHLPPGNEGNEVGMLADAFNDMAERVETRTQELVVANALAKESARLKSEFMATMSHELRTPLNATLGFSGILLEGMGGEIDEEARHMIERIDSNSRRLLGLINDVLDIAKIEAGRLELVYRPTEPQTLINQWQSQMGVLARQKQLQFDAVVDPNLPPQIYTDQERLSQVAINLLSNAFKFTERGCVRLVLGKEGESFVLQVSDTGIGIPPHAINYIFDEFRQLDGTSRRAYGGSGLGLAIVRNLCRMMDGTIRVISAVGEGSTFIVTLPLKPVLEADTVRT